MPTPWFYSNTITQYGESPTHIEWNDDGTSFYNARFPDGAFVGTNLPLLHIANLLVNDIKNKTFYITFTGFNVTNCPDPVSGIEVLISMNRGGRVTDETIQLVYNDQLIGQNKANADLSIDKTYGGSTDIWDANLTAAIVSDASFGIRLRFQSHPSWPHKSCPAIEYVALRVY